jgi:Cu2+-exporting ATPase
VAAVALAAGILAPWGINMPAAVGALVMSLSTIIVVINAQTLRRLDLAN